MDVHTLEVAPGLEADDWTASPDYDTVRRL